MMKYKKHGQIDEKTLEVGMHFIDMKREADLQYNNFLQISQYF